MIELVFIIVVIGILAAVIIPNTRTNPLQEAAIDLLSKIRYTQHLAIVNDTFNASDPTWYQKRWAIKLDTTNHHYSVVNNGVYAVDPSKSTTKYEDIDLNARYGVEISVTGTECSRNTSGVHTISFDYLGRALAGDLANATSPYNGTNFGLIQSSNCNIILSSGSQSATINISPETGYAKVLTP